jgi:hypothetical protein
MGTPGGSTTMEMCAVCASRTKIETPAETTDETGRPVCFMHAPQSYRDEQTILRAMTTFVTWHEEQAARLDGVVVEAQKARAKAKNRSLALAHRRAADAIRDAIRRQSKK